MSQKDSWKREVDEDEEEQFEFKLEAEEESWSNSHYDAPAKTLDI